MKRMKYSSVFAAFSATLLTASEARAATLTDEMWLVTVFIKGGPVMWPILFCSVLAVAIALERGFALRRSRVAQSGFMQDVRKLAVKGEFDHALKLLQPQAAPMARIARAGLLRGQFGILEVERAIEAAGAHEAMLLQTNLRGLGVLANLTPMLGLLGTVVGMIKAFNVISEAGTGDPGLVASGISEALITTAAGLIVGIPALALYHFFRGKADRLVYEMEEMSLAFVEDIHHAIGREGAAPEAKDEV